MRHLILASAAAVAITSLAVTALPAGAQPSSAAVGATERGPAPSYGKVWDILPPGQSGSINSADLVMVTAGDPENRIAVDGENAPKNFADQLEMYDLLNTVAPHSIDRPDLDTYYKDAGFTPRTVVRTEVPKDGVTIRWDDFGVPFINGSTYDNTMFGSGYAGTIDRMFLMDVLRHAGAARLAEFAGGSEANLEMDRAQLRIAAYTPREAARQLASAAKDTGAAGQRLLGGADAFLDGINAAQQALCPGGNTLAPDCPAEYAALQKAPEPWTRADLTYVASLVGGIFGKGGGAEYDNAIFFKQLRHKFGARVAKGLYNQLRSKNDADAPTTASVRTPYGGGALRTGQPGVAMPDLKGPKAPGTGHEQGTQGTSPSAVPEIPDAVDGPFGPISLSLKHQGMSNAMVVGAKNSSTGHPVTVFGPQTGYFTPQLLTEEVLVGPGVKARGVSFAGTQLVVELGHGVDYAWSATSASNDLVDTVMERLCNRNGSQPTVRSTSYRRNGSCVPMKHFTHTETVVPNPADPSPPQTHSFDVWRTRHGIVQLRTTVNGTPVAVTLQRSTYGHEVDSILGFSQLNNPRYVKNARTFQRAVSHIDYTFNWFYSDDRDISYFSSGKLPIRAKGVNFDLPRWGDKKYDWNGWLRRSRHVHQTNPPSGFFVSWNNKTAPGFSAADDVWGYGSVYRSLALSDRIARATRGSRKVDVTDVVALVDDAATVDSRARYTLPLLLKAIGRDRKTAPARKLLSAWLADGAHRVDRDRDGSYAHQAAIALFDTWWQDGNKSVAYDVVGDRLGDRLAHKVPAIIDDHPRLGLGSSWNGVPWYGYLNTDLRGLLGRKLESSYRFELCGKGSRAACRNTLRTSLAGAVARAKQAQGVKKVGRLTYDKSEDYIRSVTAGTVGVRPIDWQNRPTFQQVVDYRRHRPRG